MVGCSSGIIRCFSSRTLQYISSLPAPLPSSDVAAMCYHETSSELSVIYSDHSLVTWSLASLGEASQLSSQSGWVSEWATSATCPGQFSGSKFD